MRVLVRMSKKIGDQDETNFSGPAGGLPVHGLGDPVVPNLAGLSPAAPNVALRGDDVLRAVDCVLVESVQAIWHRRLKHEPRIPRVSSRDLDADLCDDAYRKGRRSACRVRTPGVSIRYAGRESTCQGEYTYFPVESTGSGRRGREAAIGLEEAARVLTEAARRRLIEARAGAVLALVAWRSLTVLLRFGRRGRPSPLALWRTSGRTFRDRRGRAESARRVGGDFVAAPDIADQPYQVIEREPGSSVEHQDRCSGAGSPAPSCPVVPAPTVNAVRPFGGPLCGHRLDTNRSTPPQLAADFFSGVAALASD